MDLRCESKKHGVLIDDDIVEFKCDSRFCGAGSDAVVLHRFNVHTGELVETLSFKDPNRKVGGSRNAPSRNRSAVRAS